MRIRKHSLRAVFGVTMLACIVTAVAASAYEKAAAGEPDWSYWALATESGPDWDRVNLGYLPAFSSLLRPFFALDEAGLPLYILVTLACSAIAFHLLWKAMAAEIAGMPAAYDVWHVLWFSGPFLIAVRNNQVTAQMMLLLVLGMTMITRDRVLPGAALVGLSALWKPLPLSLTLYLGLKRRWWAMAVAGLSAVTASYALSAVDSGLAESLARHLAWPTLLVRHGSGPDAIQTLAINQSATSWLSRCLDPGPATLARLSILVVSGLVAGRVIARSGRRRSRWDEMALWLAWTAFAAPFGRYYYALLLIPAWLVLSYQRQGEASRAAALERAAVAAMPVLAWGGRTTGIFAVLASLTFVLMLRRLASVAEELPATAVAHRRALEPGTAMRPARFGETADGP